MRVRPLVAIALVASGCAQANPRFPADVQTAVVAGDMRRLETPDMRLYYPARERDEALRVAARFEGCLDAIRHRASVKRPSPDDKANIVLPPLPLNNAYVLPEDDRAGVRRHARRARGGDAAAALAPPHAHALRRPPRAPRAREGRPRPRGRRLLAERGALERRPVAEVAHAGRAPGGAAPDGAAPRVRGPDARRDRAATGEVLYRLPILIDRGTIQTTTLFPSFLFRQIDVEAFGAGASLLDGRELALAAGGAIVARTKLWLVPIDLGVQVARRLTYDEAWTASFVGTGTE